MSARHYGTPREVERAFYDAFERADIDAMMSVWAADEPIACIHPGGGRVEGVASVRASWARIFASGSRLSIDLRAPHYTQDALLAIHLVKEHIQVDGVFQGVVLSTNIYQFIHGGWRMVLHHASAQPEPRRRMAHAGTLH
jgi:ketosteroid isomerase-like protein